MEIERILNRKRFKEIKEMISPEQKCEIQKVYDLCKSKGWKFGDRIPLLINMIKYSSPPDWCERIMLSTEKFKNDSSSLESFINRYGEESGKRVWEQKTKRTTTTKDKYIKKNGTQAWEDLCTSRASIDEESFIRRYGEVEGKKRRQEYLEKWTKSVKAKGGWDNGLSMESFIKRHGEEKGCAMWNARRENQRRRFSKDWFRKEYGDEWEIEWNKYCSHMADLSALGMDKGNCYAYSKKSQKMFREILKRISPHEAMRARFYEQGGEVKFVINGDWGHYFYIDFLLDDKAIEFDGKYWHKKKRAIIRDPKIDEQLTSEGYKILRIKEQDYDENPLQTVKKCVTFLLEGDEK